MAITCPKCGHHFIHGKRPVGAAPKADHVRVAAEYIDGATLPELMARYDYAAVSIYHILKSNGVQLRKATWVRQTDPKVKLTGEELVTLYVGGMTLEQIGEQLGCTREWVRQLLKAEGITGKDGGKRIEARNKKELRRAGILKKYEERRGFTLEYRREMSQKYSFSGADPYRMWERKRMNARSDGGQWDITFPQWMDLWIASGKLPEYGRGRDAYCASRIDDDGPWTIGNLRILQFGELVREMRAKEKAQGRGMYAHLATL